ncbi:MAG: hypothetical protein KBA31_05100 [Alphaproteobacteria bacterium]|nr:hypothetical protein [Alphaproteobacteria bacterium]
MPKGASPSLSGRVFAKALLRGLGWGIAAAAVIAAAAAAILGPHEGLVRHLLEVATWTAMVASLLAIFPIAPVASVVGWQLYRRGVVSPVAYAAVGALSALVAPALVVLAAVETMRYPTTTGSAEITGDSVAQMVIAAVAVAGAFGGFMGGRVLQRGAQS